MLLPLLFGVLWGSEWAEGWGLKKAQDPNKGYQLTVEKVVTVQQGLCVRVPCSFSYPRESNTKGAPVQGYWFREGTEALSGSPVATNDQSRMVYWRARDRFQLLGSPRDGNCSLLLTEAKTEDKGMYFFRVEGGTALLYSFVNNKFFLDVTGMELAGMGWDLPLNPPPVSCWEGRGAWARGRSLKCQLSSQTPHRSQLSTSPRPWSLGARRQLSVRFSFTRNTVQPLLSPGGGLPSPPKKSARQRPTSQFSPSHPDGRTTTPTSPVGRASPEGARASNAASG